MRDEDWYDLITEGTTLYDRWVAMMDDISQYLQWLKDEGVEVLFRPLHEMNQGVVRLLARYFTQHSA